MTYQSENKAQWKGKFRKENQKLAAQRISHKDKGQRFSPNNSLSYQHTYKTIKTLVLRDWDRNRRTILWRKTTRQQLVPYCALHLLGCRKRYGTTQTCVTQLIRWPESDNLLLFCLHSCAHECPLDEDWGSTMKQVKLHVQFGKMHASTTLTAQGWVHNRASSHMLKCPKSAMKWTNVYSLK